MMTRASRLQHRQPKQHDSLQIHFQIRGDRALHEQVALTLLTSMELQHCVLCVTTDQ
jgi:hypothetical protein